MRVLSLFDGIACGYEALVRAGIPIDVYYASEIDKYAIQIAKKNHPDIIEIGDVCNVKGEDYQDIDLLIGGSPCQGFSVAGKMLNFEDPRSKLFFEYVRILREVKPRYFLLENVKMKKEWQDIISRELGVEPIEINSSLVSAQNRRRLYRTNIPGITQPKDKGILLKDILEENVDEKYYYSAERWNRLLANKYEITKRLEEVNAKCNTLITNSGGNHERKIAVSDCPATKEFDSKGFSLEKVPTLLARDYKDPKTAVDLISVRGGEVRVRQATKQGYIVANDGDGISLAYPNSTTRRGRVIKGKSATLTTHGDAGVYSKVIRKLTPIEYERLQTLNTTKHKYEILFDFDDYEWFIEQTRSYVSVEEKCHKSQNVVGNVEKEDGKGTVPYAEKSLNTNNPQTNKPVQENVLTNGEAGKQVKLFLNEQSIYVSDVEGNLRLVHLNKKDDSALWNVGIDMLLEKIAQLGNEGLLEKEGIYITQKNGMIQLRKSGKEMMQLVKDAEKDLITLKKHFTSIILDHSNIENLEQKLAILFYYVLIVIVGCIQGITQTSNSLEINIETGYTAGVSDTQRYKMLGNGWTCDVVAHIFRFIPKEDVKT